MRYPSVKRKIPDRQVKAAGVAVETGQGGDGTRNVGMESRHVYNDVAGTAGSLMMRPAELSAAINKDAALAF